MTKKKQQKQLVTEVKPRQRKNGTLARFSGKGLIRESQTAVPPSLTPRGLDWRFSHARMQTTKKHEVADPFTGVPWHNSTPHSQARLFLVSFCLLAFLSCSPSFLPSKA